MTARFVRVIHCFSSVKIQCALIVGMDAVWTQLNPCNKRVKDIVTS
jgi:hypothetical protein